MSLAAAADSVAVAVAAVLVLGAAAVLAVRVSRRVQFLNETEQLVVKLLTEKVVVNGPAVYFPPYGKTLSYKKRPAVALAETAFAIATDARTGARRVVAGPGSAFLGAYETCDAPRAAPVLDENEALVVVDKTTGKRDLLRGPLVYVPRSPYEEVAARRSATTLAAGEYVRVDDLRTGRVRVVAGEARLFLEPHEALRGKIQKGWALGANEYVRLRDAHTGAVRVVVGKALCIPGPSEAPLAADGGAPKAAIDLKAWEYSVIQAADGTRRVERGPKLVVPGPDDVVVGREKRAGATVDAQHAALVRDRATGATRLETAANDVARTFTPAAGEEIVEVRELVKLAEHECVLLSPARRSIDTARA